MNVHDNRTLRLERVIRAPVEKVFDAFVVPRNLRAGGVPNITPSPTTPSTCARAASGAR